MQQAATRRIFLAGASGAVGRVLCRLLVAEGWEVTGTTRSPEKAAMLRDLGVTPVIVDAFDRDRLRQVAIDACPAVVIHQLTDLPPGLDPARMAEARVRNARLREVGTRHVVAAALAAGAGRLVAQSIAFAYAPGAQPYREESPLAPEASAVASLERQVLKAPLIGIVLRYGRLYGPGTGFLAPPRGGALHVDAAADAARRAVTVSAAGVYNVAEDDGTVESRKARDLLGWKPDFRAGHT